MTNSRGYYRKNLSLKGLLFIGGVEHEMQVQNLSVSGLQAAVETTENIVDERDVFMLIKQSSLVDIYIEKLHLAGEAEIVRVDIDGNRILLGLEFKQISYDSQNILYKRKAYRKSMTAPGQILIEEKFHDFMTRNVSVEGILIRIAEFVDLQVNMVIEFKFDKLRLYGESRVVWFEHDDLDGTLIGLEYLHMEKSEINTIPQFYHPEKIS
ncbi:PilZ domain-containing protein [Methyloprofundus sp.]|uniref:PilZ domain-containing protein n=1 Tax=Methyloprofundus sp. TaxID=2020875 RepID=UPI003D126504